MDLDTAILWRVAIVQLAGVAVLSLLLGLAFSHGFFESWGWIVGPVAWMACAWATTRVVGLPTAPVLVRAALAGVLSALFVIVGLHWLGAAVAVAVFAVLCAGLPRPTEI
jgi:hypothetical protein